MAFFEINEINLFKGQIIFFGGKLNLLRGESDKFFGGIKKPCQKYIFFISINFLESTSDLIFFSWYLHGLFKLDCSSLVKNPLKYPRIKTFKRKDRFNFYKIANIYDFFWVKKNPRCVNVY